MEPKDYKKIVNSQKLSTEIHESLKDREKNSSIIEEFAKSKPELIRALYDRLNDDERVAEIVTIIENIDQKKNVEHLLEAVDKRNKSIKIFKVLKVVSSVAAIFVASLMVWLAVHENNTNRQVVSEIKDGMSLNPTLKLSSGKVYELVAKAEMATRTDIRYIVEQNSKMSLGDLQREIYSDSSVKSDEILHLELSVPKKSSYTVVLSDGSEVVLNANSSISYPETFATDKREVTIKGEAFFNVKKSKIPFIVNTGSSYVKVYGTTFNINARDTNKVQTTLVEGLVGVGAKGITEQMLKPNQIAVVYVDGGACIIKNVDAKNSIGWIMGSIICLDNNLESLIHDLEAWYGVDIRYEKQLEIIKNIKMNILIAHTMGIDEALRLIEKVIDVKFINEGGYYSVEIEK